MVVKEAEHRRRRPQPLELVEDRPNRALDFLVRVEFDRPVATAHVADRHGQAQLASPDLAQARSLQARLDAVQLDLADRAPLPQHQAVVELAETSRPNPSRSCAVARPAPLFPWSSSTIAICSAGHPNRWARSANAYWRRALSGWRWTWVGLDWRT